MNNFSNIEIDTLLQQQQWPAISIYMPVSRIGDQQDPIRYKNFLGHIERRLIDGGMRSSEARSLLAPEYDMVQDNGYWKHIGNEGLAVFRSGETELRYSLPLSFQDFCQVGQRFHIKPLVPLLNSRCYLVLALSKSSIRLFEGNRFHLQELDVPEETPRSMAEALKYDDPEKQLRFHTQVSGQGSLAMFHGQGVGIDEEKVNLARYFQAVDRSLFPRFDEKRYPIVLAGIDELCAIYQQITKSNMILEKYVARNVNDMPLDDLCRRSWEISRSHFANEDQEAINALRNKMGTGLVAEDLQTILTAASEGRVDTLFLARNHHVWGRFDPAERQMTISDSHDHRAVDLLDEAVHWTIRKKGAIFIKERQEMPVDSIACAHLRY